MKILITGAAGFIGFHLSQFLVKKNFKVYGIDTLNNYYNVELKLERLSILKKYNNFKFYQLDISKKNKIDSFFDKNKIDIIINLAAYAGVQYSLKNPDIYFKTNEIGFYNILENAKRKKIRKILFASSSSVAGDLKKKLFSESDNTDSPISLYAATKKNNEILAHFYSKNYKIKIIGIRFFTVYGPLGRPDLSIYKFANAIQKGATIKVNNFGNHYRDFTFIDDVVQSLYKLMHIKKFHKIESKNNQYFQIFNIGSGRKIKITKIVNLLEKLFNMKTQVRFGPKKIGDVISSQASIDKLQRNINYIPQTKISEGLKFFVEWFVKYKKNNT
jgi:UDP-glucuronate 4-epimerase